MTQLFLPPTPSLNQQYVANNGITYVWLGDRWNTVLPLAEQTAVFYYDGGDSTTWATPDQTNPGDIILDGGTATG
jgi:hypothetical protein